MNSTTPKKKNKSQMEKKVTSEKKKSPKNLKRKSTDSVAAILTDASTVKKKKVSKKENSEAGEGGKKVTNFEKGKKKPLNVIQTAAKKLKNIKNGDGGENKETTQKLGKRKHETEEAKPKIETLKFKDRKKLRKTFRTNYDTTLQCKKLWEQLRRADLKKPKKHELATQLYGLVKGRAKELIFAHDTSRVIQCLVKYGSPVHKDAVFEELKGEILNMIKNKYAKFVVRKMLKYGKKEHKNEVFTALYGKVKKLMKHSEAADIVELAYNDFANAQQRSALVEEFYGPSFALFKTQESRSLSDILTAHPEKRESILDNMKETLCKLVDKSICQYSIVHRVFVDYFSLATEKARSEMIEVVRESLVHMLHTRDGARVAMQCLWHGTAKDRKVIVKSLKTFVLKICKEEYGHLVLLVIFDVVDDTKLVQKVILEEMMKSMGEVFQDQHARKVVFYLLNPRDPKHFHPDILRILQQGDGNATSKKEPAVRHGELLTFASGSLLKFVRDNANELWSDNATLLLLTSIINTARGDASGAMRAMATIAAKPYKGNSADSHIVENAFGHVALKRMIMHDKERTSDTILFSRILTEVVPAVNFKTWTQCNRGCFILCSLLDLQDSSVTASLKNALGPIKSTLKKMEFKGAEILASKLKQ